MASDSENPSLRPRLHSGLSQHVVPPDIVKVADILGRTIMRVEDVERWRERRRDQFTDLEHRVTQLDSDDTMPDSVFVEDIGVAFDELAIVTRPGAASRRAETAAVEILSRFSSSPCTASGVLLDSVPA